MTTLSAVIGYTYLIIWSVSFYFSGSTIISKKSSEGYSINFNILNCLGFSFLSVKYLVSFFKNEDSIMVNDILFAVHALVISLIIQGLILYYPRGKNVLHKSTVYIILIIFISIILYSIIYFFDSNIAGIFDFIGMQKILITIFKYIIQIRFNFIRKSTYGWSTVNTVLDISGGALNLIQYLIDHNESNNDNDNNMFNNIKFLLGNVTIFFDLVLLYQRFILYRYNYKSAILLNN